MPAITMKPVGAVQLRVALLGLGTRTEKQIARTAIKKAARIVLDTAKEYVPEDTGLLKRSLKIYSPKTKKKRVSILVGTKDGDYKGDTFYGAFVELGHKIGKRPSRSSIRAGNDTRAEVPGQFFLRGALDDNADRVRSILTDEFNRAMASGLVVKK